MTLSTLSGDDIKQLRHLLNLSQEAFSEKLGVSLATVNRWENNRSRPGPSARKTMLINFRSELNQVIGQVVSPAGLQELTPPSPRKRILVIDDDDEIVNAVIEALINSNQDYVIEFSADGYDAGMKAITFEPDLIVMDMNLPGLSGLELCERLRHHGTTKDIQIVAMTQRPNETLKQGLGRFDVTTLLNKPLIIEEFIQTVKSLLTR